MSNYYALISGLPNITVDQSSIPISSKEYVEILNSTLNKRDKKLLDIILYESIIKEVASAIDNNIIEPTDEELGAPISGYSSELINELNLICYEANEELPLSKNDRYNNLPIFIREFVYNHYLNVKEDTSFEYRSILDELSLAYFEFAQDYRNSFIKSWFILNKNIRNILALYTCNKLGWNKNEYIIGNTEFEVMLRESSDIDLDFFDDFEYLSEIVSIAKDNDIASRERKIDLLKWTWLEEYTFARVFDIDSVLSYYIKLSIIERWVNLNEERGEKKFRDIVLNLKESSRKSLKEFKDKQRK